MNIPLPKSFVPIVWAVGLLILICGLVFMSPGCQKKTHPSDDTPSNKNVVLHGTNASWGTVSVDDIEYKGKKYRIFRWERGYGSSMTVLEIE